MPQNDGERIAANTQAIRGLRADVQESKAAVGSLVTRVRIVEGHLGSMAAERREERRLAKARQESIQTWLRLLTVAVSAGGLFMSVAIFVAGFYFHR